MPKVSFAQQPLHPQLIVVPAALIPCTFVLDLLYALTGKASFARAARYTLTGGVVGGLAAGGAGHFDLHSIPRDNVARKVGELHALLNVSIVLLSAFNIFRRRGRPAPSGPLPMVLSGIATGGLFFTTWLGRELVYHHGMRVEGVSPVADVPEVELPGSEAIAGGFRSIEQAAVERGL